MESKSLDAVNKNPGKHPDRQRLLPLLLGLTVFGLVTLICLGGIIPLTTVGLIVHNSQSVKQVASLLTNKPIYNQITFVGNDNNLWLVSPDGTNLRQVTDDGKGYIFPTWAPDGRYLAFIGTGEENAVLYVSPASKTAPTALFSDSNSIPFYLYWSPNSKTVTFLTQEKSSLAMRQVEVNTSGQQRLLGKGSPFYWTWSPKGDKLLMHVGGSRASSDKAHISILESQKEAVRIELDLAPGRFQAPVWSSDGDYFFYVATNEEGAEAIYRTNADTLEQEVVTNLSGFSYITLAPDGERLAYLQIDRRDWAPLGTAYIVDADGRNRQQLMDKPVGSMYWSPDGKKLALLSLGTSQEEPSAKADGLAAPLPQKVFLRWWIYHIETEELELLITFSPTIDFFQTMPYFDQYHLSLTFWSPDSRYFVVTKAEPGNEDGTIWVVDMTGQEEPLQIGEGRIAVWSWR
jgi:Tol biopolymer transport system component